MKSITEQYQEIINDFDKYGICIDFNVFQEEQYKNDEEYIFEFFKLFDSFLNKIAEEKQTEKIPKEKFFRIQIYDRVLKYDLITWSDFIGNENAQIIKTGKGTWSVPLVDGLKTGFFNPPYGINILDNEGQNRLYNKFIDEVIGKRDELEIKKWNTDWCNYFDAGNEWWGSFLWTIRNKTERKMVIIGMSTTD